MQAKLMPFDEPLTDGEVLHVFGVGDWLTRRLIAEKLRRAKSPTLIARTNKLAREGFLRVEFHRLPNGVDMWCYQITEKGVEAREEWAREIWRFAPIVDGA